MGPVRMLFGSDGTRTERIRIRDCVFVKIVKIASWFVVLKATSLGWSWVVLFCGNGRIDMCNVCNFTRFALLKTLFPSSLRDVRK
jgi:hypothetical protein